MSEKKYFALSDEVIFQIRELVQLAMLTGTNLVDHMRQMRFEEDETNPVKGHLTLTEQYKNYHLSIINGLMEELERLKVKDEVEEPNSPTEN